MTKSSKSEVVCDKQTAIHFFRKAPAEINCTLGMSPYDFGRRITKVADLADYCGVDQEDEGVGQFACDLWQEADDLRVAACTVPPRNLRDVAAQLSLSAQILQDLIANQKDEDERHVMYRRLEKLVLGMFEIVAPAANVSKKKIAPEWYVTRAEELWGTKIEPEIAS